VAHSQVSLPPEDRGRTPRLSGYPPRRSQLAASSWLQRLSWSLQGRGAFLAKNCSQLVFRWYSLKKTLSLSGMDLKPRHPPHGHTWHKPCTTWRRPNQCRKRAGTSWPLTRVNLRLTQAKDSHQQPPAYPQSRWLSSFVESCLQELEDLVRSAGRRLLGCLPSREGGP